MPALPISALAQNLLQERQMASNKPKAPKVKPSPSTKPIPPAKSFTTRPMDSSVEPDGTKAPKAKRSTKAARDQQAEMPGFAEGGEIETAGASGAFKGPKNMRPVRGGPAPKKAPYMPTEEGRMLPPEVKPPMNPEIPGAARGEGFVMHDAPEFGSDAPEAAGAESRALVPLESAGEGAGINDLEEAGIKALIRKYAPEAISGVGMGLTAGVPIAMAADLATNSADAGDAVQNKMDVAENSQGAKTSKLLAQRDAANPNSGTALMAAHGSDADRALAQQFLQHLKKNAAAQ